MSCTLCRLPFTPAPRSVAPDSRPPEGVMTAKQNQYFMKAVGIGSKVPFTMCNCEYVDQNLFGSMLMFMTPLTIAWKTKEGTMMMFHTACVNILRHIFDCTADTMEALYDLCEIDKVLGRTMIDVNSGRLPHVKYEEAGAEKVDLRPYYQLDDGLQRFDWERFKNDGYDWAYTRPDTFPRFHQTVSPSRVPAPAPAETKDALTTMPLDILHALLPYLTDKSFVSLLSTCRTFRHHALTTYQHQARERVRTLGWAIPLRKEYASAPQATRDAGIMINPDDIPSEGDWMLYLCNAHKSKSMRARRWIWATAEELRRTFLEHKAGGPYDAIIAGDGPDAPCLKSPARVELEKEISRNPMNMMCPPRW
ncbi:hypothetical protein NM688_g5491 [Phlebia brevispora]|uniref:Uncharacterized protein n=1 Tax=Phlebia brevispora TaxID=194682 RepID=A0ACC1SUM2_9APHY|nr:hypothetical protein NM688_g5491 [Phlebia brevispora]